MPVGNDTITALYGGDSNFGADTATLVQVVNKATATLALSNLTQVYDASPKAVTVTTTPPGLSGVGVTYDGSGTVPTAVGTYAIVASLTNQNYQATNATGTLTIQATIAASTGANGTISPSGIDTLNPAASQTYTMTPATGYHVANVLVDGASVGAVTSYPFTSISASHTISVTYAINMYTVTSTANGNGTVNPSGVHGVNYGDSQLITVTPEAGYHITALHADSFDSGRSIVVHIP